MGIIQEDSGNDYGERTFISEGKPGTHEFSGAIDFSGFLKKTDGKFDMKKYEGDSKGNNGQIAAESAVAINDKVLGVGLQCHNIFEGVIAQFGGDRGGQLLAYKPRI